MNKYFQFGVLIVVGNICAGVGANVENSFSFYFAGFVSIGFGILTFLSED